MYCICPSSVDNLRSDYISHLYGYVVGLCQEKFLTSELFLIYATQV